MRLPLRVLVAILTVTFAAAVSTSDNVRAAGEAPCDLLFTGGPLLAVASPLHAGTAAVALMMTGLVIIGLVMRPRARVLDAASWVSAGLVAAGGLHALLLLSGA